MASGHVAYPYLFQNQGIEHKSIVSRKQNSCQIKTPRVIRGPLFLFQTSIIWVSSLQTNKYLLQLPSGEGVSTKWSKGYIWQQLRLKIKSGWLQAHFWTQVRILKRRVRTVAMTFLLSVLVLFINTLFVSTAAERKDSSTVYLACVVTAASL